MDDLKYILIDLDAGVIIVLLYIGTSVLFFILWNAF